jgi:hypothetical protein
VEDVRFVLFKNFTLPTTDQQMRLANISAMAENVAFTSPVGFGGATIV